MSVSNVSSNFMRAQGSQNYICDSSSIDDSSLDDELNAILFLQNFLEVLRASDIYEFGLLLEPLTFDERLKYLQQVDEFGLTALHYAIIYGKNDFAELILGSIPSPDNKVLFEACPKMNISKTFYNVSVNEGDNPLLLAVKTNNAYLVKLFLRYGTDVNAKDRDGASAIHWAIVNHCETILEILLNKGADVSVKTKAGNTPLMLASLINNIYGVQRLLEKGAGINAKNNEFNTAMILAAESGNYFIVKELAKRYDIDIDATDLYGQNALMYAILSKKNTDAIVCFLIEEKQANLELQDRKGATILMYLAAKGNRGLVEIALKAGADIHKKDENGLTALDYAIIAKNDDIANLLQSEGTKSENLELAKYLRLVLSNMTNSDSALAEELNHLHDLSKKNALFIFPNYEKMYKNNLAFSVQYMIQVLASFYKRYNIEARQVRSLESLNQVLKDKFSDLLFLSTHGSSNSLHFSDNLLLKKEDIEKLNFSNLKEGCKIISAGCCNALGFAQELAKLSKRVVFASEELVTDSFGDSVFSSNGLDSYNFYNLKGDDITTVIYPNPIYLKV